jgi:ABC-2 type transport system permease protein
MAEIARRAFDDRRRALIWWVIGTALYTLLIVASFPSVSGQSELNDLLDDYPPEIIALFSGGETTFDLTSAADYLNSQIFALILPLLLSILAINFGASTIAGEEEQGTLELVMSHPVSRRSVVNGKAIVLVSLIAVVAIGNYAVAFGLGRLFDIDSSLPDVLASLAGQVLLAAGFGFLALAAGAFTGSRGTAIAVAAGVAGATYLLGSLGPVVSWLEPFKWISPFYYATGENPLANGIAGWKFVVLVGFCLAGFGAALTSFQRRDMRSR